MGNTSCTQLDTKEDTSQLLAGRFKVSDKVIGKGSFATVKLGFDVKTKKKVAIRFMPTQNLCPVSLEHLKREAEIHPTLNHEGIVKCLHCKQDEEGITMVQEYVTDGSLLDYYAKKRVLSEFEVKSIFSQLISAVSYMHAKGVVHRDIKADNILIYANTQTIRLADLGFADRFSKETVFRNFPGTLAYSPPEVLQRKPHRPEPRDIWSCGVLLYILLTGRYPFGSAATSKTKARIINDEPDMSFEASKPAKDLVTRLLCKDPERRVTMAEVQAHPWLASHSTAIARNPLVRRASSIAADLMPGEKRKMHLPRDSGEQAQPPGAPLAEPKQLAVEAAA